MKKIFKVIIAIVIIGLLFFACSNYMYRSSFGNWQIEKTDRVEIVWADFLWKNEMLSGKYYEKTAMLIPCRIKGIPNNLTLQFDTGSGRTMIYENSLSSFYFKNKTLLDNLGSFNFPANLLKSNKLFKNLQISIGEYSLFNERVFVLENYGTTWSPENVSKGDTIHIGTIGVDLFQDKVLIIDYPRQKFAIRDEVPAQFKKTLIDIELDKNGKPVLPLQFDSKKYRLLFDNGSSLFPIITAAKNIHKFSSNPILDSIEISSWGTKHFVNSRMITDTFKIGRNKFSNVKVYESHTSVGMDRKTDGMIGNFLFWDNIIVIDFINKKFGIQ